MSAGCDEFVRKPYRDSEVFEMMERFLGCRYVHEIQTLENLTETFENTNEQMNFGSLPKELLENFYSSIQILDTNAIRKSISQIHELNAPLGAQLQNLADDLKYTELMRLLSAALGEGDRCGQ